VLQISLHFLNRVGVNSDVPVSAAGESAGDSESAAETAAAAASHRVTTASGTAAVPLALLRPLLAVALLAGGATAGTVALAGRQCPLAGRLAGSVTPYRVCARGALCPPTSLRTLGLLGSRLPVLPLSATATGTLPLQPAASPGRKGRHTHHITHVP
jgi:hypothetical protein